MIGAGGTMNREAVALGTPVWTTFDGRLGAVDELLLGDGRLLRITRPEDIVLERRPATTQAERVRRDPQLLVDLLWSSPPGVPSGAKLPACADVSARRSRSTGTP